LALGAGPRAAEIEGQAELLGRLFDAIRDAPKSAKPRKVLKNPKRRCSRNQADVLHRSGAHEVATLSATLLARKRRRPLFWLTRQSVFDSGLRRPDRNFRITE
jgi:hypothetical protein